MTLFYLIAVPLIVGGSFPFERLFQTVTFIFGLMPGDPSLVWAGWTIGAEMMFYVLLPFALVFVRSIAGSIVLYLIALGASVSFVNYFDSMGSPETYSKLSIFGSFGIFAIGIVMYHVFRNENVQQSRVFWGLLSALAAILIGALLVVKNASFFYTDAATLRSIGLTKELAWASVFGLVVISQALRPLYLITNRLFVHLGDLSFSIYLCHPPVVYFLKPIYAAIYASAPGKWSALFVCAAMTFSIVYIVSLITFRFVERPGIALGEHIILRRTSRSESLELPKAADYGH